MEGKGVIIHRYDPKFFLLQIPNRIKFSFVKIQVIRYAYPENVKDEKINFGRFRTKFTILFQTSSYSRGKPLLRKVYGIRDFLDFLDYLDFFWIFWIL